MTNNYFHWLSGGHVILIKLVLVLTKYDATLYYYTSRFHTTNPVKQVGHADRVEVNGSPIDSLIDFLHFLLYF